MLRYATSPTGDIHIESLRVALFNYIVSIQKNEDLIVRIEDSNKQKNTKDTDKDILEILNLFSLKYTQVIHQSDYLKYHTKFAMQLLVERKAFNCFCSDEILEKEKNEAKQNNKQYMYNGFCENLSDEVSLSCEAPFTVRIKKPNNNIQFKDLIKGNFDYKPLDIDSFVILEHDKTPTYNFACAIDDMINDISTVIREDNHISNTPKQIHIRNSIGYEKQIQYIHLPSILNKSDDTSSVKWLISQGYLPAAIANYLVLLSYTTPKEIFTLEEAIQWFDISKILKTPAKFDIDKLNIINKDHIKNMDELRLSKLIGYSDQDIGSLAKIYLQESDTLNQIKNKINTIFKEKTSLENFEEEYKILKQCIINAPYIEDFNEFKKYIAKETSLKEEPLSITLKYILTGNTSGPNLSDIYPLIRNYIGEIVK